MDSSTVPCTRYSHTVVSCCWPIRSTRAIACSSSAVLSNGSHRKTWLALTKLRPEEWSLAWSRKHSIPGSSLNLVIPWACLIDVYPILYRLKAAARTSKNWLNLLWR